MSAISGQQIFLPLPAEAAGNPEKWNSDWETLFRTYGRTLTPQFFFTGKVSDNKNYPLNKSLDDYSSNLLGTCVVQRDLTLEARHFYTYDLEARWLSASRAIRRKHLLHALAAVCSRAVNLNAARGYCTTELDLERLSSDGQFFLDLLQSALLDASVIPKTPRYIAHPDWDAFAAKQEARADRTDEEKVAWAEVLMLRTKLICYVLHFTIRMFFNLDPLALNIAKRDRRSLKREDAFQGVYDHVGTTALDSEALEERKRLAAASFKEQNKKLQNSCSYPGCQNLSPADGSSKFKHCPRCFQATQRRVLYCSPICQKADWKLRHKAVCGKPLSFDDVSTLPDISPDARRRGIVAPKHPSTDSGMQTVAMPTAEQAATDAHEWDRAWDSLLRVVTTPFCFIDMVYRNESHGLEATLASYPYLLSNTSSAQYQLTVDAQMCFKKDFEARWRAAGPGERSPHVLGALAAVCSQSQNLNLARAYCATELRVEPLCNDADLLLDLLRSAMLDDIPSVGLGQPKYISNQSWDELKAGGEETKAQYLVEVTRAGLLLMRIKVICYVLDFLLRSFCDMNTPIFTASMVEDILARGTPESPVTGESIRECTVEPRTSCSFLKCLKLAPADGHSAFQRCGTCFSQIQRQVFYCSRECQLADWKLRHKKTCGQTLTFDDVSTIPGYPADALRAVDPVANS
ncbi:hypothetical protein FB45DRAFT_148557 [Roridomyces roridus]|uniref:MYND-type domain-containing protein n=1 Tax=Roridomyces roridus TaxID=1738132 RepID=A0AAD7BG91_9AGAR|nr:hypothetical protein FB45DRAFT_148557 [Roridomyces roridus]